MFDVQIYTVQKFLAQVGISLEFIEIGRKYQHFMMVRIFLEM